MRRVSTVIWSKPLRNNPWSAPIANKTGSGQPVLLLVLLKDLHPANPSLQFVPVRISRCLNWCTGAQTNLCFRCLRLTSISFLWLGLCLSNTSVTWHRMLKQILRGFYSLCRFSAICCRELLILPVYFLAHIPFSKRAYSPGSKFFLFSVYPFLEGRQNNFDRVASL